MSALNCWLAESSLGTGQRLMPRPGSPCFSQSIWAWNRSAFCLLKDPQKLEAIPLVYSGLPQLPLLMATLWGRVP